jgi:hypothetical protein
MRGDDDYRSNVTIKREVHRTLAQAYDIRAAIDDDPEIVELCISPPDRFIQRCKLPADHLGDRTVVPPPRLGAVSQPKRLKFRPIRAKIQICTQRTAGQPPSGP